jgi:hypothetical protein
MPTCKFKELIRFTKRSDSKDFLNTTIQKENRFFHTIYTACAKKVIFWLLWSF